LVLIFIGAVFLLENTGYLPHNSWLNLWRLWPLILVLVGLELLLGQRIPWPALAGLAAVVLILGSIAAMSSLPVERPRTSTQTAQTSLGGASQAAVTVRFGAGQLTIGPLLQPDLDQLATMTYDGPTDQEAQLSYSAESGRLDIQTVGRETEHEGVPFWLTGGRTDTSRMDINLNPSVPITILNVQTGATEARLDLSNLRINSLDMSVGAATTWVRFPQAGGAVTARIRGGASSIALEIPQNVAAQIRHRGGLSSLNVDQSRFPPAGDNVYRSRDYDSAQNKVDLTLDTGVTSIQVN
jgi:Domain of unknown function (DUF5668)